MISNIKVTESNYDKLVSDVTHAYKFLQLSKTDRETIERLKPTHPRRITFDVKNSNTAICNAFRRVMLDEIKWPRLTCAMEDIKTDDAFCQRLTDYIQNRIWLAPTGFMDAGEKAPQLQLDVKNLTAETIIVTTADIKLVSGKKIEFSQKVELTELLPGRYLRVPITVEWGINRSHATYSNFNALRYVPLQYQKELFDVDSKEDKLPSSCSVTPTDYGLGFSCEQFIDPTKACVQGWQTIWNIIDGAQKQIEMFVASKSGLPYISDALNVSQLKGDRIKYEFFGESYTLGEILGWYGYMEDPSIDFIMPGDDHPEDQSILIKISHKDHSALLIAAAKTAKKDVERFIKSF